MTNEPLAPLRLQKVCLGQEGKRGLAKHWNQEATDLRESLLLQHQCISTAVTNKTGPVQSEACSNWIDCLKNTQNINGEKKYFFEIKALLEAMAAKRARPLPQHPSGHSFSALPFDLCALLVNELQHWSVGVKW